MAVTQSSETPFVSRLLNGVSRFVRQKTTLGLLSLGLLAGTSSSAFAKPGGDHHAGYRATKTETVKKAGKKKSRVAKVQTPVEHYLTVTKSDLPSDVPGRGRVSAYKLSKLQEVVDLTLAPSRYDDLFEKASLMTGIPAVNIKFTCAVESGLKPGAVSPTGPTGLGQHTKKTGRWCGLNIGKGGDDRRNAEKSIMATATYLAYNLNQTDGKFFTDDGSMGGIEKYYRSVRSHDSRQYTANLRAAYKVLGLQETLPAGSFARVVNGGKQLRFLNAEESEIYANGSRKERRQLMRKGGMAASDVIAKATRGNYLDYQTPEYLAKADAAPRGNVVAAALGDNKVSSKLPRIIKKTMRQQEPVQAVVAPVPVSSPEPVAATVVTGLPVQNAVAPVSAPLPQTADQKLAQMQGNIQATGNTEYQVEPANGIGMTMNKIKSNAHSMTTGHHHNGSQQRNPGYFSTSTAGAVDVKYIYTSTAQGQKYNYTM